MYWLILIVESDHRTPRPSLQLACTCSSRNATTLFGNLCCPTQYWHLRDFWRRIKILMRLRYRFMLAFTLAFLPNAAAKRRFRQATWFRNFLTSGCRKATCVVLLEVAAGSFAFWNSVSISQRIDSVILRSCKASLGQSWTLPSSGWGAEVSIFWSRLLLSSECEKSSAEKSLFFFRAGESCRTIFRRGLVRGALGTQTSGYASCLKD